MFWWIMPHSNHQKFIRKWRRKTRCTRKTAHNRKTADEKRRRTRKKERHQQHHCHYQQQQETGEGEVKEGGNELFINKPMLDYTKVLLRFCDNENSMEWLAIEQQTNCDVQVKPAYETMVLCIFHFPKNQFLQWF